MRAFAVVVIGVALLGATGVARAHEGACGRREQRFESSLVGTTNASAIVLTGGRVEIEAEAGGEVKLAVAGVADAAGPLDATDAVLKVTGVVDGAAAATSVAFPFAIAEGEGRVRGTLALADGAVFEIQAVTVERPAGVVFAVPGITATTADCREGDDDDDDQGDDNDQGWHGGDRRSHRHGGHEGEGSGGYDVTLVADSDVGDLTFDSAGGAHVAIDPRGGGSVRMRITGVVVAGTTTPPPDGSANLVVSGRKAGAAFQMAFAFPLVGGEGSVTGALGLAEGDVLEIAGVTVDVGPNTVFAVPGLHMPGAGDGEDHDGDDDGVSDDGDACAGTPQGSMVSASGCTVGQLCGCSASRRALRRCVKAARAEIRAQVKASCSQDRKACRTMSRHLAADVRLRMRSCR